MCFVTGLMWIISSVTGQGQPDYSAAWATYYQQLYQQQQAAAATGQGAPGMMTETIFALCKEKQ